ncbi:hypothetical protein [Dyadobacter fermentans]|uniref:hypothetical protein n=1 Tax=Dyadobacter fermentans TaxID=94254 RepID=UPI001CBED2E9|nr:hypothetical protein [Dyadobacter fermentans]MBZ1362014.1 hypothetical protein [Dyadobacter fermentans]
MSQSPLLPTPQQFLLEVALYKSYAHTLQDRSKIFDILFFEGSIDAHCPACKQKSVFLSIENRPTGNYGLHVGVKDWHPEHHYNSVILKSFRCSRDFSHRSHFIFNFENGRITKIGQYPSHADISVTRLDDFKKVIEPEVMQELRKAYGLFGHGVGVGSFVYLRRVIERYVVEPAYDLAKKESDWDDVAYGRSRFGEKLELLRPKLPEYLFENTNLYGVVSKGIHALSEDECKEYFPVVSEIVLHILTDLKAKKESEESRTSLRNSLNAIAGKIA